MRETVQARLKRAGFQFRRPTRGGATAADVIAERDSTRFAVTIRLLSAVRGEEVLGLLADAYLRLSRPAESTGLVPLIVLVAPRWTSSMIAYVESYRERYLPDGGLALIDEEGGLHLVAANLRIAEPAKRRRRPARAQGVPGSLFTDLNQWMLKILVKNVWQLGKTYVTGPVATFATHRELADAAKVSVGRAWTLHHLLRQEGFLAEELVRVEDLLDRWRGVSQRGPGLGVRWPIGTDYPIERLHKALENWTTWPGTGDSLEADWHRRPRTCLAGSTAAYGLGHGLVSGSLPEIYVEKRHQGELLRQLGVKPVEPGQKPDFYLAHPRYPESVFRACVAGLHSTPTADVIQTWLDLVNRPDRGQEQADLLRRRILHAG